MHSDWHMDRPGEMLRFTPRQHRLCAVVTLVCMAALYAAEHVLAWSGAVFLISLGYLLEAIFEALRPSEIPSNILV